MRIVMGSLLLWVFTSQNALALSEDAAKANVQVSRFSWDPTGHSLLSPTHSDSLRHLELYFQAQVHYLSRPLIVADSETDLRLRSLVAHRAEVAVSVALGLFDRVDVAILLPVTLEQLGRFPGRKFGQTAGAGLQDLQLVSQISLVKRENSTVGVSARGSMTFPTGEPDAWMSREGIAGGIEFIVDATHGSWHAGARLGYEFIPAVEVFTLQEDDHVSLALAANWEPKAGPWRSSVEWNIATRASAAFQKASELYGEFLLGLGYAMSDELEFTTTAGFAALPGIGGPEYRFGMGIGYHNDSLVDDDRDGLANPLDSCPNVPEDLDGFEDEDGCPDIDNDGDQVLDEHDACPLVMEDMDGFEDQDGCPELDNDGDGIEDSRDACIHEPEDKDDYEDADGCPDLDDDGDEILDENDSCRLEPEDFDEFEDEDGCPDTDNDNDGLQDEEDECPNEAETINGNKDEDGCPDEGQETLQVQGSSIEIQLDKVVFFERGRARLQKIARPVLQQLAQLLKNHRAIRTLRIVGHTDKLGNRKVNEKLALRRAEWMKHLLVKLGISADRIEAVGAGWDKPRASNESGRGRARNRRVEFQIVREEAPANPGTNKSPNETK